MTGIVVVTHGQLAVELVTAAETIVGDQPHITGVSIGWHDDVEVARRDLGDSLTGRVGENVRPAAKLQ